MIAQDNNTIRYQGQVFTSTNFVRLLRRAMDRTPIYCTLTTGERCRIYHVGIVDKAVTFETLTAMVPAACCASITNGNTGDDLAL